MADAQVVFDHVWKRFRRGERHDSLRDLVPAAVGRVFGRRARPEMDSAREFWALEDVAFEVKRGEAFGIIGPNGAGKSTTLKLLTKILRPTRGQATVRGRIGALIEVAAGFHPDLTGRENIFLQGAVMGMRGDEVRTHFDAIVEFAGVSDFIDTPVKRYSSGMNARLGFSIAAHLDPEVLIIDEVLSVGDAAFQARCVQRMTAFRDAGTTIVFVSHDLQAVGRLCHRALYLRHETRAIGATSDVIAAYLRDATSQTGSKHDRSIRIAGATLLDAGDRVVTTVAPGAELTLRVDYEIVEPLDDVTLGLMLYRSTDHFIGYEGNVVASEIGFDTLVPGRRTVDYRITANVLRGQYHLETYVLHTATHEYVARLVPAAMFAVEDAATCRGIADLALQATVRVPAER